ncbi:MAG: YitT family protein [Bacilli bacterium]|nr:YitT family protein [Bacilli bacterium]MDD4282240.1 YitT family protein [Bacilli bacterium]MDD4718620.1 YitT family protein [Bacilli bacterium]
MKKNQSKIKNNIFRYTTFVLAMLVFAGTYNMFLVPNNIVTGGVGGIAIMVKNAIEPSVFIFLINIILIIISYFILGKKATIASMVGAFSYPLFVSLTSNVNQVVSLNTNDMLLNILFSAVLMGGSIGFIIKYGFSTGGTEIAASIVAKLLKISMGNAFLIVDGIIILSGAFFFGIINTMYAIIFIYIYSIVTDKIILGISDNKAFYIITEKEEEVKNYILNNLHQGVTLLSGRGGYEGTAKNVIFCVVSVKNYFKLKEGINEIDKSAFFIVTDAYEVKGGA